MAVLREGDMGGPPKIGGVVLTPQIHGIFIGVFHEINHPFWGPTPIFGLTPICELCSQGTVISVSCFNVHSKCLCKQDRTPFFWSWWTWKMIPCVSLVVIMRRVLEFEKFMDIIEVTYYILYIYIHIYSYVNNIVVNCLMFFRGKGPLIHTFGDSTEASANPEGNIPRLCSTLEVSCWERNQRHQCLVIWWSKISSNPFGEPAESNE